MLHINSREESGCVVCTTKKQVRDNSLDFAPFFTLYCWAGRYWAQEQVHSKGVYFLQSNEAHELKPFDKCTKMCHGNSLCVMHMKTHPGFHSFPCVVTYPTEEAPAAGAPGPAG